MASLFSQDSWIMVSLFWLFVDLDFVLAVHKIAKKDLAYIQPSKPNKINVQLQQAYHLYMHLFLNFYFFHNFVSLDCSDLFKSGYTQSGVYPVNPDGRGSFNVYCDMRTDGGGWTVLQRRQDGLVDFYRGWNDYKSGFGQLTAEFWLGNDRIHRLTVARPSSLRVELEDWNGVRVYAKYGKFQIGDEHAKYRLEVGSFSGTAGDSLRSQYDLNNMAFSTKDRDNDIYSPLNCAVRWTGAWWYRNCQLSNLNGKYLGNKKAANGVRWATFRNNLSLKYVEMKMRSPF